MNYVPLIYTATVDCYEYCDIFRGRTREIFEALRASMNAFYGARPHKWPAVASVGNGAMLNIYYSTNILNGDAMQFNAHAACSNVIVRYLGNYKTGIGALHRKCCMNIVNIKNHLCR